MAIIQSCCCWRSLRKGCYASASYTLVYFAIIIVTMANFVEVEWRFLSGEMKDPESESFLQPAKITPTTVTLNIILLGCSTVGFISCILLIIGVYKDLKFLLIPWILTMGVETCVELVNTAYLFYLETFFKWKLFSSWANLRPTLNFNPITSFLFTLDFFVRMLNVYAIVCVVSQYQEFSAGRGTPAFDVDDRVCTVQYTAAAQHTTTTSSVPSGKRRVSSLRPLPSFAPEPSRVLHDEASVAPPPALEHPPRTITSMLVKSSKPAVKKHVQFPDEKSPTEVPSSPSPELPKEKQDSPVVSSLWMERESETVPPER